MANNVSNTAPLLWERGRENGSFPVAEILKPLGFKNIWLRQVFGGGAMLDFLAGEKLPGIEALKQKSSSLIRANRRI